MNLMGKYYYFYLSEVQNSNELKHNMANLYNKKTSF